MQVSLILWAISFLALGCSPQAKHTKALNAPQSSEHVIYGMNDLFKVESFERAVAIINHERILATRSRGQVLFTSQTVAEEYGLCRSQPLARERALVHCSGYLLDQETVLTAGHCIEDFRSCSDFSMQQGSLKTSVSESELLECKSVQKLAGFDLALIKLKKPVKKFLSNHSTKSLNGPEKKKLVGEKVFSIGFPLGGGLKKSYGVVRTYQASSNQILTNIDSFDRSSGSPVFLNSTGQFLGTLISGETDFVESRAGCLKHNTIPDKAGIGEIVQFLK